MKNGSSRVLGIMLFTLIGASALVLGVMNTEHGISAPMQADANATEQFSEAVNGGNTNADIEALKSKDTDGDGLSDYDELYVYHTSPYIKDSDSDGIPDGVEVKNGTDPNCPQGQDCGTPAPVNGPQTAASDQPTPDITNIDDLMNAYQTDGSSPSANDNTAPSALAPDLSTDTIPTATTADAAQIRQLLKDQGLSDDVLNSIDDQTLVQMYNDSAKSVNNSNGNSNINVNTNQ
jgi:hypothetical protein